MRQRASTWLLPSISALERLFTAGLIISACIFLPGNVGCSNGQVTGETTPAFNYMDNGQPIPMYWNLDWLGNAPGLYLRLAELGSSYTRTNPYLPGTRDCNDMAVGLWQDLVDSGITSLLAAGNLEKTNEPFTDCNHAWLIVYSGEGAAAALEATTGNIYLWEQVASNPQLKQYWEAFMYANPDSMKSDFHDRW